jgi:hypothetical protein
MLRQFVRMEGGVGEDCFRRIRSSRKDSSLMEGKRDTAKCRQKPTVVGIKVHFLLLAEAHAWCSGGSGGSC